jgi:hypothetical protein
MTALRQRLIQDLQLRNFSSLPQIPVSFAAASG